MMDVKGIAGLYNTGTFSITKEFHPWDTDSDKRYVFLVKYADGQELAIKVCRNAFTTREKISGWKALSEKYLSLGIYCPQIIDSIKGSTSETFLIDDEEFFVYAEEAIKYKTYEDLDPKPDFEVIKRPLMDSIGLVAANCMDFLPFPSAFCLYTTFDTEDSMDENFRNAESFCKVAKEHFSEYSDFIDGIWDLFLRKRKEFEPIHRLLPKASFQSDLNRSNILVDDSGNFAGYIDFNLSGTETVLGYILINDICGYRLKDKDLDRLNDKDFRKMCDDYLYDNLKIIQRHYDFSDLEKDNLCLCYNTVYPFSCWTVNAFLDDIIKKKREYIKPLLDWVYFQLSRTDIKL